MAAPTKVNPTTPGYELEKQTGERLPNGAKPLKKLGPKHRELIRLHLMGHSNNDICHELGYTPGRLSVLLQDPLIRSVIDQGLRDYKNELEALTGQAVDGVRQGLHNSDLGMKLKAVDRFIKLRDNLGTSEQSETAEDVAQKLLTRITNSNVQINFNQGGSQE